MSERNKVVTVIDPEAKSGIGKNNKPWSQAKVELDNGEQVWIFNPIAEGQEVESYTTEKDGKTYTNWRVVRVDPKHDEVMKALRAMYKMQADIFKEITGKAPEKPDTGLEQAREQARAIKAKVEAEKPKEDVVVEDDGEPINLDDIPF